MKKSSLTAVVAERLFAIGIIALLILLVADFIFVTNFLKSQAKDADHARIQADISDNDISQVRSAQDWLSKHQDEVGRAAAVVADSTLYQYQNQIIEDFQKFASRVGVSIGGYSFSQTAGGSKTTSPQTGSTATPTAGTVVPAPQGVKPVSVTINIAGDINYEQFLRLLKLIEQNVTRMQVTDVNITPNAQNPNTISNPTLNVTVYTKAAS